MAFKMKGSPMARNFGVGKSSGLKHVSPDKKAHSHGDVHHDASGEVTSAPEGLVEDSFQEKGKETPERLQVMKEEAAKAKHKDNLRAWRAGGEKGPKPSMAGWND